jgi:hypothetical protein
LIDQVDDTEQLANDIQNAANDLESTREAIDDGTDDDGVLDRALQRMKRGLNLAGSVINGVGAHIYNQWCPSPDVPVLQDHFDPSKSKDFEKYKNKVSEFLEKLAKGHATINSKGEKLGGILQVWEGN